MTIGRPEEATEMSDATEAQEVDNRGALSYASAAERTLAVSVSRVLQTDTGGAKSF
jgi:hypothetical protein